MSITETKSTSGPGDGASGAIGADEVLASAHALVPELRERANEFDQLRQLPQDIAQRMATAGMYRLCAPAGSGGLGLGPRVMCEVTEVLATGAASAGWCSFIASTSHLNMAGSSKSFREEVGTDPDLIVAGVFAPSGTAKAESRDGRDGYVVNGHWRWGSGCRNASWISGALTEVDADGEPVERSRVHRVWLQPDQIDILDNWHVTGMRGTGSSDFVADDVWVPVEHTIVASRDSEFADDPIFSFPLFGTLSIPMGAISLGLAQASLDELVEVAATKTPQGSRRTVATRPLVHFQFAQAQTQVRAARALLYDTIDELWDKALSGVASTAQDRVAIRTANYHAVHTASAAIDQAFSIAGGTAVYEDSALQRNRRDVHVACQHMMNADSVMELAGRVLLGVDERGAGL